MNSIEKQMFTWEAWDEADTAAFMFYNVVLLRDLGPLQKGSLYTSACIDYERSELVLYKDVECKEKYIFNLTIDASYVSSTL